MVKNGSSVGYSRCHMPGSPAFPAGSLSAQPHDLHLRSCACASAAASVNVRNCDKALLQQLALIVKPQLTTLDFSHTTMTESRGGKGTNID
jgi:hypothetical protein